MKKRFNNLRNRIDQKFNKKGTIQDKERLENHNSDELSENDKLEVQREGERLSEKKIINEKINDPIYHDSTQDLT